MLNTLDLCIMKSYCSYTAMLTAQNKIVSIIDDHIVPNIFIENVTISYIYIYTRDSPTLVTVYLTTKIAHLFNCFLVYLTTICHI
jgi:hypothetical protein